MKTRTLKTKKHVTVSIDTSTYVSDGAVDKVYCIAVDDLLNFHNKITKK